MTLQSISLEQQFVKPQVAPGNFVPIYVEDFVNYYCDEEPDLVKGFRIKNDLGRNGERQKINPILQLAQPEDAEMITELVKESYNGTYPFKEFENPMALYRKLEEGQIKFILLKGDDEEVYGAVSYTLKPEDKKGYLGFTAVWKKYLGKIDVTKAYIGINLYFHTIYKDQIQLAYGESRTAHAKIQYIAEQCSFVPSALLINKDIFLGKIESDLLMIALRRETIENHRREESPKLIPEVVNSYIYASDIWDLGPLEIQSPNFKIDIDKTIELQSQMDVEVDKDEFGYQNIKFYFQGNDSSYFKFLYTPTVNNFEKVEYFVSCLEELVAFCAQLRTLADQLNIRYIEIICSAYEPDHQKLFYEVGFRAQGYLPCWKYNKLTGKRDDHILMNYFEGEIASDIDFVQRAWDLYGILNPL